MKNTDKPITVPKGKSVSMHFVYNGKTFEGYLHGPCTIQIVDTGDKYEKGIKFVVPSLAID